jgi:hypothetical protein
VVIAAINTAWIMSSCPGTGRCTSTPPSPAGSSSANRAASREPRQLGVVGGQVHAGGGGPDRRLDVHRRCGGAQLVRVLAR